MTTTNEAWADEIRIMQEVLLPWKDEDGQVIFEYDIPRLGKRIDVVLLLRGLIFCLEFKTRQEAKKENMQSYIEQVLDYALDLKNFHLLSQNRIIVPILIHPWISKSSSVFQASVYDDSIYNRPTLPSESRCRGKPCSRPPRCYPPPRWSTFPCDRGDTEPHLENRRNGAHTADRML